MGKRMLKLIISEDGETIASAYTMLDAVEDGKPVLLSVGMGWHVAEMIESAQHHSSSSTAKGTKEIAVAGQRLDRIVIGFEWIAKPPETEDLLE